MMRKIKFIALISILAGSSVIAEPARAVLNKKSGSPKSTLLVEADKNKVFYIDNINDTTKAPMDRADIESIFFYRPSSFHKGLEAYIKGDFDSAKTSFATCKSEYASLKLLPGNYSVISSFYEMECARRSGDLKTLNTLLNTFRPEALTNENYITQLSIYPFWNAVNSESWDKVEKLAKQWDKKKLPGYQRAQVAYCHGLALQAKDLKSEALLKFNEVLALSEIKEVDLIENASEKILDIMLEDPAILECKKAYGSKNEDKKSRAFSQLLEASSVARLWDNLTSKTRELPAKYSDLVNISK